VTVRHRRGCGETETDQSDKAEKDLLHDFLLGVGQF
jgi:hypothetical protein